MQRPIRRWLGISCGMTAAFLVAACTSTQSVDEGATLSTTREAITQDETTPIGKKWVALRDAGIVLGDPSAAEQPVPGGAAATYQQYTSHVIVYSNDFGAVYMPTAFFNKWTSLAPTVYGLIRLPTGDVRSYAGNYDYVPFERGEIIDSLGVARVVYGPIYKRFQELRERLGMPLDDEYWIGSSNVERFQTFAGGELYHRFIGPELEDVKTHAVLEPMLTQWRNHGGWAIGLPVTDSHNITRVNEQNETLVLGRSGWFDAASIHMKASGEVFVVDGAPLSEAYRAAGGPGGWLGFPTHTTMNTPGGTPFNDCEHGVIVERMGQGDVPVGEVVGNLRFLLSSAGGRENCWAAEVGGDPEPDLRLVVDVSASDGPMVVSHWAPASDGAFDSHPPAIDFPLGPSKVAKSNLEIFASVGVVDVDDGACGGNDGLGYAQYTFNIDNLWGVFSDDLHYTDTGVGWARYSLTSSHAFDERDFRGQKYWSFSNFTTYTLQDDDYDASFVDIDAGDSTGGNPFERLFYDKVYNRVARNGNCNGMNGESVRAQLGRSIIGMPIHDAYGNTQNGSELNWGDLGHQRLYQAINAQQGSQLGTSNLLWRADMVIDGVANNPLAVFDGVSALLAQNRFPMIGITDDQLLGKAHSIRPYKVDVGPENCRRLTGQCKRIFVADPNHPTGLNNPPDAHGDRTDDRFIEINQANLSSYWGGEGEIEIPNQGTHYIVNGDQAGRMLYEPGDLFVGPQVSPAGSLWDAITNASLFLVIFGDAAGPNQVTDAQGRTLFQPASQDIPHSWSEVRQDPALRIPGLVPVVLTDTSGGGAQILVGRGSGATHTYEVMSRGGIVAGTPLESTFMSTGLSSHFVIPATPARADRITLHDINGPAKEISLALPSDGTAKPVTWTISGGVKERWMELSALGMSPSQSIRIRAENGGKRLRVTNAGPTTSATLRYNDPDRSGGPVNLGTVTIPGDPANPIVTIIEPGLSAASFSPLAWYVASPSDVVLSNGAVSVWHDRSGNGFDVSNHLAHGRPTYNAAGWNDSKPTLTFSGTNLLRLTGWSGFPGGNDVPFTVLGVIRSAATQNGSVLAWWSSEGWGSVRASVVNSSGSALLELARQDGSWITQTQSTTSAIGNDRHFVAWRFSPEVLKVTVDGTTSSSPTLASLDTVLLDTFLIGARTDLPTWLFQGDISELVVIPSTLSDSEVEQFRTNAKNYWGGLP